MLQQIFCHMLIFRHDWMYTSRRKSFPLKNITAKSSKNTFRKSTGILVQGFLIILINEFMSTLCMKQHYLLHTFFQRSTWIFAEKYKCIINYPVTNIKSENNCFVLKNYPLPTNEFERKTSKSLKLDLDWYTSVVFCPRVNVHRL